MKKAIEIKCQGIKCDAPGCAWQDQTVTFDAELFLNEPCPVCGSNLFTLQDYDAMQRLAKIVAVINIVAWPFMVIRSWFRKNPPQRVQVNLDMNGTGQIQPHIKE